MLEAPHPASSPGQPQSERQTRRQPCSTSTRPSRPPRSQRPSMPGPPPTTADPRRRWSPPDVVAWENETRHRCQTPEQSLDLTMDREISVTQTTQDTQLKISKLEAMLEEDPAKHVYRIDRAAFTDEELFELEMKHIFEGNWIFLAHESQIPNPNDYPTSTSAASRCSSPATRMASCTRWPTPVPPRRHPGPSQEGQQVELHLPVPRLDLQQRRQAAEGQGSDPGRRLPRVLQQGRQPRPGQARRLRELPRLPVRQHQPGRRPSPNTWAKRPRSST